MVVAVAHIMPAQVAMPVAQVLADTYHVQVGMEPIDRINTAVVSVVMAAAAI
jgi:hypothetical protein